MSGVAFAARSEPALAPRLRVLFAWTVVLGAAVLATAIAVVYVKHESRIRFVELQALERDQDEMEIEWGRLQLEQSTWATHDRVEKLARERLDMHVPPMDSVVVVEAR